MTRQQQKKSSADPAPVARESLANRAFGPDSEQPATEAQAQPEQDSPAAGHSIAAAPARTGRGRALQPKLTLGAPSDPAEQEAARPANQVVRRSQHLDQGGQPGMEASLGHSIAAAPIRQQRAHHLQPGLSEIAALGMSGPGAPLRSRGNYRTALGGAADMVRVYTGALADQACDLLHTRAYSYAGGVVLGASGQADRDVIDHEAYHAVQQRTQGMDSQASLSRARDAAVEGEASRFAASGRARSGVPPIGRAQVPRLSFYTKKSFGGKEFRVSDDENMAVRQDTNIVEQNTYYGSKHFYAEPTLIGSSDATLQGQQSAISLSDEPGVTLTVNPGAPAVTGPLTSPRFMGDPRLEAIMRGESSQYIRWGSKGEAVQKVQQALIDAGHPLPEYGADGIAQDETISAVRSFQTSVGLTGKDLDGIVGPVTLGHLDRHFGGGSQPAVPPKILHRVSASNINTGTSGGSMTIVDDCGGAAKTIMMGGRSDFDKSAPQGGKNVKGVFKLGGVQQETPAFTTSKEVRDYVIMTIMGKATAAEALAEYWSKDAAERDQIDRDSGINNYAGAQTGEAHSIVSGDGVGWNWHWGAVVMQSGGDSVTMENFAGSGDTAWDFQMYATTGGASFHGEQHQRTQDDEVTPEYGYQPITVRIKPA